MEERDRCYSFILSQTSLSSAHHSPLLDIGLSNLSISLDPRLLASSSWRHTRLIYFLNIYLYSSLVRDTLFMYCDRRINSGKIVSDCPLGHWSSSEVFIRGLPLTPRATPHKWLTSIDVAPRVTRHFLFHNSCAAVWTDDNLWLTTRNLEALSRTPRIAVWTVVICRLSLLYNDRNLTGFGYILKLETKFYRQLPQNLISHKDRFFCFKNGTAPFLLWMS
jgi:hypothetical protein